MAVSRARNLRLSSRISGAVLLAPIWLRTAVRSSTPPRRARASIHRRLSSDFWRRREPHRAEGLLAYDREHPGVDRTPSSASVPTASANLRERSRIHDGDPESAVAQITMGQAVELTGRLHDHEGDVAFCDGLLEPLEAAGVVGRQRASLSRGWM